MSQKVLAIDDSQEIHQLLGVRLRGEGVTLHHALDGEQGLKMARELQPDLILLDIDMPDHTGFEVCQKLKSDPQTECLQVIFLTAADQVFAKVQGFDLGAIDYITKPFESAELRARVRAALRTKRYQDLLATRAQVDGLTGLRNRAYFDRRLDDELATARRSGRPLSLVLLDLDHFKRLNDDFGHPFGDRVLQAVGEVLVACLRGTDTPCRFGGEEFALVLGDTDGKVAVAIAERIRARLAALRFEQRNQIVAVTGSLGVVVSTDFAAPASLSAQQMIKAADDALYTAKRAGRNRVCRGLCEPVGAGVAVAG